MFFSVFDFPAAQRQIMSGLESHQLLAFMTPAGQYERPEMPTRSAAARPTQQRPFRKLVGGAKWVCAQAYSEDVVIRSDAFNAHVKRGEALP